MTDLSMIEAHIAISEVKARYCRTLDTKDWAGYAGVFTEDVELDTRPAGGTLTVGRDAVLSIVRSAVETARTVHQVHSPEITLNGDGADVIWAMQDRVVWGEDRRSAMGNSGHTGYGHYHEHYVREGGQWRIAKQKLTRLHVDTYDEVESPAPHETLAPVVRQNMS
jgi:3-phenylpropionate/cinnamic acid dioxygenase small subunit